MINQLWYPEIIRCVLTLQGALSFYALLTGLPAANPSTIPQALELFAAASAAQPSNCLALLEQGRVLAELPGGDPAAARDLLQRVLHLHPKEPAVKFEARRAARERTSGLTFGCKTRPTGDLPRCAQRFRLCPLTPEPLAGGAAADEAR